MTEILMPYIRATIEADPELQVDQNQKAILLLDCYPVHIGEEFRTYVRETFPNVFLLFIPANCTGIFQPADVGLQRVIKHRLRQSQLQFLVSSHETQVAGGLSPEKVEFTTSLPVLRNASVSHILDVWNFLNGPYGRDIVRKVCLSILAIMFASNSILGLGEVLCARMESLRGGDQKPQSPGCSTGIFTGRLPSSRGDC